MTRLSMQAVPCVVVFRALGLEADRDILEHIVYDFSDADMVELLKPSIDVGMPINRQELALDFIGMRPVSEPCITASVSSSAAPVP
jgi:DNA-directed RNA polymerase II subunit RPB2